MPVQNKNNFFLNLLLIANLPSHSGSVVVPAVVVEESVVVIGEGEGPAVVVKESVVVVIGEGPAVSMVESVVSVVVQV